MDASEEQLKHCEAHPNITFRQGCAESTGMQSHSVDLVTVATALHWCAHLAVLHLEIMESACPPKHCVPPGLRRKYWPSLTQDGPHDCGRCSAHWSARAMQVLCPSGITHDTCPARIAEDHHESPRAMADMSGKRVLEFLHPQCGLQDENPRRCMGIMRSRLCPGLTSQHSTGRPGVC